jgi:hypothetical protein
MPRAALLSIHARVNGAGPTTWEDPSLVQLWGLRFSVYVVAAKDLPVFSLGRLSEDARRRARAHDTASRLHAFLNGRRMPFGQAGHEMGVHPNSLRYAAPTGRVLLRWDGARQPVVWAVPAPGMEPPHARLGLLRRYLHVFGPATASSFASWAGIHRADARLAWEALDGALTPVRTPTGDRWILAEDETAFRNQSVTPAPARLLPSGDAYYLLWGTDRELLVPDAKRRAYGHPVCGLERCSWEGKFVGVWRRSAGEVSIEAWRRLSSAEREAVEVEPVSLPLPGLNGPIAVRWS